MCYSIKKIYKYIELKKLISYYSFFWFFEKGVATPGPWGWQECYGPWELYSLAHTKTFITQIAQLFSFFQNRVPFLHLAMERVTKLALERPVVIFSKSSCCMCHTMKTLFSEFKVNPTVYKLDEIPRGRDVEQGLDGARTCRWCSSVEAMKKLIFNFLIFVYLIYLNFY
jgi:hypothetical protein